MVHWNRLGCLQDSSKGHQNTKQHKKQQRRTKKYLNEVRTYAVNDAKWKAAREYCKDRQMVFMILTEKELQV